MNFIILFLIFAVLLLAAGVLFLVFMMRKSSGKPSDTFLMLQQQINHISQILDTKMSESNKTIQEQYSQSAKIIRDVTERLTRLDETNRQVVNFTDQLRNLQNILKNPQQRGAVGEYFLEAVLKNTLPPGSFQMQYSFKDGKRVDAVVFVDKRIIPIDSKFSVDNYNKMVEASDQTEKKRCESAFIADLKARIEETSQYVRPEEKTMDFAFMFIPHEAVYYDLLINKVGTLNEENNNLIYYAGKKKVIVVSPTSFLAYLQTVLQGLKNQKISEQAQEIIKEVERLGKHMGSYSEYMKKLGSHLGVSVATYNKAARELAKVDKDVVKITGEDSGIKIQQVEETPLLED